MFVDWRSFGAAEKQGKKDSITFYTWANRKSFSEFYKFPILFECCEQIGNKIYILMDSQGTVWIHKCWSFCHKFHFKIQWRGVDEK